MNRSTEKTRLELLIRTDDGGVDDTGTAQRTIRAIATGAGNVTRNQATIKPPVEAQPGAIFPRLVLQVGRLIELFVVVDAENAGWS